MWEKVVGKIGFFGFLRMLTEFIGISDFFFGILGFLMSF
jgi:hypothetical protein